MDQKANSVPTIPIQAANMKPALRPTLAISNDAGTLPHITARNCRAMGKVASVLLGASSKPIKAESVISSDAQVKAVAVQKDNK